MCTPPRVILFLQGAECTSVDGAGLTHLVVSDDVPPDDTPVTSSRVMVVKQQVFIELCWTILFD